MIQTHNAKARAIMLDSQLPKSLWAEAINTANYLLARSPTAANKGVTPYEKLYGNKPTISHLRRFGCVAYRMLPAPQRHGKFASRAEIVYMLGYAHDSTTIWRLWDADTPGQADADTPRQADANETPRQADAFEMPRQADTGRLAEELHQAERYKSSEEAASCCPPDLGRRGIGFCRSGVLPKCH